MNKTAPCPAWFFYGIGRITFKNPRPKVGELHTLLNDGFMSFRNLWLLRWKLLSCAFCLLICGLSLPSAWLIEVTALIAAWQELESPRRPAARHACEGFHGLGWSRLWCSTDQPRWTYSLWCSDSQQVHSLKPWKPWAEWSKSFFPYALFLRDL